MLMCKKAKETMMHFNILILNAAPYPMMLLAFDWMLDDLVWFCTVTGNFSALSVDPTFSLDDFDVTVTTYCHLLLKTQCTTCGEHQVMKNAALALFSAQAPADLNLECVLIRDLIVLVFIVILAWTDCCLKVFIVC